MNLICLKRNHRQWVRLMEKVHKAAGLVLACATQRGFRPREDGTHSTAGCPRMLSHGKATRGPRHTVGARRAGEAGCPSMHQQRLRLLVGAHIAGPTQGNLNSFAAWCDTWSRTSTRARRRERAMIGLENRGTEAQRADPPRSAQLVDNAVGCPLKTGYPNGGSLACTARFRSNCGCA